MAYALVKNGTLRELSPVENVDFGDGRHCSYGTILVWSDEERARQGIVPIVEPVIGDFQQNGGGPAVLEGTVVRRNAVVHTRPLDEVKKELSARIDNDAERQRLKFITPGAGMALTYQEKFAQAHAVVAMDADVANALTASERAAQFPTLSASVGIEADTLVACAQLVLAKYAQFAQLSLVIERARLAGKKAVADAGSVAAAVAAYQAVTWPLP